MKLQLGITLCAGMVAVCAVSAAQDAQATTSAATSSTSGLVSSTIPVYKLGKDVTAPELIPTDYSKAPVFDCERIDSVKAKLTFIVDAAGIPHEIQVGEETDGNITLLMLQFMRTVRFKPAQLNGTPVAVGLSDKINFEACYGKTTDATGKTSSRVRLRSAPNQEFAPWKNAPTQTTIYKVDPNSKDETKIEHVGGIVKAPIPIHTVNPAFSDQARAQKIQGTVMVTIIVDTNGDVQDVEVVKPMGYGLDQKAIEAVKKYRFQPATRDGKPVPVYITVAINFRLY
jgi:TonB family protein